MKRTAVYRPIMLVNAGSFVLSLGFLLATVASPLHYRQGLGHEPALLTAAAALIVILTTGCCYAILKRHREYTGIDRRAVASAAAIGAAGVAAFLLPALLTPALAPMIWWALSALGSSTALLVSARRARPLSARRPGKSP